MQTPISTKPFTTPSQHMLCEHGQAWACGFVGGQASRRTRRALVVLALVGPRAEECGVTCIGRVRLGQIVLSLWAQACLRLQQVALPPARYTQGAQGYGCVPHCARGPATCCTADTKHLQPEEAMRAMQERGQAGNAGVAELQAMQ